MNITAPIVIYSVPETSQIRGYGQSPQFNVAPTTSGNRFGPVILRDLYFHGANQALSGYDPGLIYASEIDDLTIENCSVISSGYHGISTYSCQGKILGNYIVDNAQSGIFCRDTETLLIDKNRVKYSGNNGIYVIRWSNGSDQSIVSNNQVGFTSATSGGSGQYGNAILVVNANYVKVIDNMTYSSAYSAIRFNNSSNSIITGNQCYNSGENAIYVEAPGAGSSWYGSIISNNRVDVCSGGISAANSDYGAHWIVVTGNQISNCSRQLSTGGWGRGIHVEADGLIANNQVDTADDWGIFVNPQNNGSIGSQKILAQVENNMLKNCAGGICFYKDDTTYARLLIGGNMVYNYTTTSTFAAIVPGSYNGATGAVTKLSGATDLGNATTSGFTNVKLILNYSFT